ncbi:MAG: biopolymer transporter ExbD [Lentisphaerae bacterium]|nr:biopolymer transporter ExbD [Lentisphaerota bacterium]
MKIRRKQGVLSEINVGAFSDIAFLLIIFFILTSTFVQTSGRKMDIPSGTSEQSEDEQKQLSIDLRVDEIYMGEEPASLTIEALRERLADADLPSKSEAQRMVLLESHKDVPYDRYFKVVTAISQAGGILALLDETEE